jgi:hypothetical protein
MPFIKDLHLFCRVVANFGDIGVWWRLARHFMQEYGFAVMVIPRVFAGLFRRRS